uniref:LPS-assembly protein LptD n=1 Tax=Acidicaldus sp. TaxID=1872105 RepID=A0A8J4HBW9_9PROT
MAIAGGACVAWRRPLLALLIGLAWPLGASAQPVPPGFTPFNKPQFGTGVHTQPIEKNGPVSFTADQIVYDRDNGIVTATGHVEAWQNDHVLRADKIVYDRNTDVVAATGHVVLLEPDGEVLFSDYAELTAGMREAVMRGMRSAMQENARLAANGGRRTDGVSNEMSRVVYSACTLCKDDPSKPPVWQLRAYSAVDDLDEKRIKFQDATMEILGVPIFYLPYVSTPDSTVKRESGFLAPDAGTNTFIGAFVALPYYYVIDKSSDITITPWLDSTDQPQLETDYRQRFNNGSINIETAIAYDEGAMQGLFFGKGDFSLDENWRYGFNINEASSANYLRDFIIPGYGNDVLSSTTYLEGFGQGAYSRLDTQFYQGLLNIVNNAELPYVLPRYLYDYVGTPDELGGYVTFNGGGFNVLRFLGTDTQRINGTPSYNLPEMGPMGQEWNFMARLYAAGYEASSLNQIPNFSRYSSATEAQLWPVAAAKMNWPFSRTDGNATTVLEPITQFVVRPNGNGITPIDLIPNEDSIDPLFTDANLFSINRMPGIDRLGGGLRADLGMHFAWFDGAHTFDALIGQSYRSQTEYQIWGPGTGLGGNISDIVGRAYFQPSDWFDIAYRFRLNHDTMQTEFNDTTIGIGPDYFRVTLGYIYSNIDPFYYYNQPPSLTLPPGTPIYQGYNFPRNEVLLGAQTKFGNWRMGGYIQENMALNEPVAYGLNGGYEDDCTIIAFNYFDLFTDYNGISNVKALMINITFKTLGQFGFPLM